MEKEKVGDSHSSSDPVSPTSNEIMKEPPRRLGIGTPEICFEKIKSVLEKLKGGLPLLFIGLPLLFSTSYWAIMGMVMIMGYLHTQKYKMELENEWGDAIKNAIKSKLDAIKSIIDNDDGSSNFSGRIPDILIPEFVARHTEVLYHGEKESEFGNYHNGRDRTVMAMDCIQSKTSRVPMLQEIASQVPKVADTKITMEHSKNSRWWWWW
ncbi:uncharacterized protein LOC121970511 [Zingiber officinale]|uniref:uncharacterized protein LOC121970511 n=1 Tax=Zingiber officinale TaxID=94328 RepID=UPI001C4D7A87|nr:uncharacterized protein LOC121970511 [Zingiber officinale]